MKCPQCGLINPPDTIVCYCGYCFETKTRVYPIHPEKPLMKKKTAQRFIIVGGIMALLGGGSCFLALNPPVSGDSALGWLILGGFSGIGALVVAAVLGIIGLVGLNRAKD